MDVGKRYSELGDEIERLRRTAASESRVVEFVDTCVGSSRDSRRASDVSFQQFKAVVSMVVECDEAGHRKCYQLQLDCIYTSYVYMYVWASIQKYQGRAEESGSSQQG